MSLTALPVTQAHILTLQQKISVFQDAGVATTKAAAINAHSETVKSYACELLAANVSLAQVAMAVPSIMVATPTIAEFENLVTNFLPNQIANANAQGLNPTAYAAEVTGLLYGGDATFNSNYSIPATWNSASKSVFAAAVASKTGVNSGAILNWLDSWIAFYTANPSSHPGQTIAQAAGGATVGDAVGVALENATSANLMHTCTGHINGLVSNALVKNALGTYTVGTTLSAMAAHALLQGET